MINRKGFLAATLCLTIWMVPVSADETADDIVTMMGWWQEYGRYWDEIDADTAGLGDDLSFAWLEKVIEDDVIENTQNGVVEGIVKKTVKKTADTTDASDSVIVAKRSEP